MEEAICNYAEMFKIHTGIIVGLLQHRGVVPVGYLDKLKSKLKLSC